MKMLWFVVLHCWKYQDQRINTRFKIRSGFASMQGSVCLWYAKKESLSKFDNIKLVRAFKYKPSNLEVAWDKHFAKAAFKKNTSKALSHNLFQTNQKGPAALFQYFVFWQLPVGKTWGQVELMRSFVISATSFVVIELLRFGVGKHSSPSSSC